MQITKNILIIIVGLILVSLVYNFSPIRQGIRVPQSQTPINTAVSNEPPGSSGDTEEHEPGVITVKIDQGASIQGIKIVPTAILEDSRCPANANCIWAGQLRVKAILMADTVLIAEEFVLGKPKELFGRTVLLASARPQAETGIEIPAGQYEFDFEIR